MPSLHRSGNSLIQVSENHHVQRQYFGILTSVNSMHLLHNELSKAILLRGHEQYLRAKNHYTYSRCRERASFVVTFTAATKTKEERM
jgi:hypothetical protein